MANQAAVDPKIDGTASASSAFIAPQLSLPKGGGALRGIDEKFSANPANGTGSLTVPIATSPGRSGFGPQLALKYDSGAGNSAFGIGWSVSLPSITRRTDKGLPRYDDAAESDIFILSGSEDLVPQLVEDGRGNWIEDIKSDCDGYAVKAYRPRTEGLFARIERWTSLRDRRSYWRSISRDNVLTLYGIDDASRIADPLDPTHIFTWLISRSYDDKGNAIVYDYVAENDSEVDLGSPSERHRLRVANRYIKCVRYGNRTPLLVDPGLPSCRRSVVEAHSLDEARWMFSVVFDYGEDHYREEPPDEQGRVRAIATVAPQRPWRAREDPFSTYRSRFEVRTHRLCRRVLMFHHLPSELGRDDYLVKSTVLRFRERRFGSFIERITQCGHVLKDGRYLTSALPSLELAYSVSPLESEDFAAFSPQDIEQASLDNLQGGVDGRIYRWLDLDGEGIAGVLADQDGTWLYKPNMGNGRFGVTETVKLRPAAAQGPQGAHHLMDVAGDGNLDLVDVTPGAPGFYGRTPDASWLGFRAFRAFPVLNWNNPNLRLVDLTGDGIADILITEDDAFTWHASLLEDGFAAGVRVHVPLEEERSGPRAIFSDAMQSIFLGDMTGDGLSDILRIRNGEVCYWPNLGYGRFGAKIILGNAPWFDEPDLFDPRRIRLADTDGSGTTDILYFGRDAVQIYLNWSGNSLSEARRVDQFPPIHAEISLEVADLLGRGTACLIWSSPLPPDRGRQIRYIDLMRGEKPHLLSRITSNAGSRTRIEYTSSTQFYLADKAAGTPWVTRLPFPAQVVQRIETVDEVSRSRVVTRYSYHHGFYDGVEREFRGFGRVDQLDTEDWIGDAQPEERDQDDNWDDSARVPPILTRTWIHTGAFVKSGRISRGLAQEYFREPEDGEHQTQLCDTILPDGLTAFEAREACRALKGSLLRREVYAIDGTPRQDTPYLVSESNFTIVPVQPRRRDRHAVFFTHAREAVSLHYERQPTNPRVSHNLTLAVDPYGNVLRSVAIGYQGRQPSYDEQAHTLATLTESRYTNAVLEANAHRTPLPAEGKTFQLTAPELRGADLFPFAVVEAMVAAAVEIPFEARPSPDRAQKRLIGHRGWLYRANDLSALLPEGKVESLTLPGEEFTLALTSGLLETFKTMASAGELAHWMSQPEAGYRNVQGSGPLWTRSGRVFYSPRSTDTATEELAFAVRHFFLPHRYRDPFGNPTSVDYDPHDLAATFTCDAAGNETTGKLDYRSLQLERLTDPNGNRAEARFDALGMLVGTAILGKATGLSEGDSFDHFQTDLAPTEISRYLNAHDPCEQGIAHLGTATTRMIYDLHRVPMCVASVARETHVSALGKDRQTRVQLSFAYSDGFGRIAQTKARAESGPLNPSDPHSSIAESRWAATGAKMYNNKGHPVRQYEPFFSPHPQFGIERWGVSSVLFYDPLERVVATLHPNRTFEKVSFDAWMQKSFDTNDTVLLDPRVDVEVEAFFRRLPARDYLPSWYRQRIDGQMGPQEKSAAQKAARHANTPALVHLDALGRCFLDVADNGVSEAGEALRYHTRRVFDIQGNQLAVIDARGREAIRYVYDLLGNRIHQRSIDSGDRWVLYDIAGKPLRLWNSRGYAIRMEYDELRRLCRSYVKGGNRDGVEHQHFADEHLFQKTIYGDSLQTELTATEQQERNLRGKRYRQLDDAGVVVTARYDFKGNALTSERRYAVDFAKHPNWLAHVALETESFATQTDYDALNRAIAVTTPDGSIYRPRFDAGGQLQSIDVNIRGARQSGSRIWSQFVRHIHYNARGQRTLICCGNGATTNYEYDPDTFRLMRQRTVRASCASHHTAQIFKDANTVQSLRYTYDPAGNITRLEDAALREVFFANRRIEPASEYIYDPLYRLACASGREHVDQAEFSFGPPGGNFRDFPFAGAGQRNDLKALRRYTERYEIDCVGNFQRVRHEAEGGHWIRDYSYDEPSLLEPGVKNNRVNGISSQYGSATLIERYRHDANGNVTQMPHLPMMEWDFHDQLRATSRQVVNAGVRERTLYFYDASGQRVRKLTLGQDGCIKNDRRYVGGFEIFREYRSGTDVELERQTLHVMDDRNRIALIETQTIDDCATERSPEPVYRYQLANHLSSATVELNGDGGLLSYEEYGPYGTSTFQAAAGVAEVSRKRYRYTGKERDEESGFTYHGARYYAPWLGAWTAPDPSGVDSFASGLYRYCRNNPITMVDANGKNPDLVTGGTPPPPPPPGFFGQAAQQVSQAASSAWQWTAAEVPKAVEYVENETPAALESFVQEAPQEAEVALHGGSGPPVESQGLGVAILVAAAVVGAGLAAYAWAKSDPPKAIAPGAGGPAPAGPVSLPGLVPPNVVHKDPVPNDSGPKIAPPPAGQPSSATFPAADPGREPVVAAPGNVLTPLSPELDEAMKKDVNALSNLANKIHGPRSGVLEIAVVETPKGKVLIAGLNSSAKLTAEEAAELKRLGINIAPQQAKGITRDEGGAPHAEENIKSAVAAIGGVLRRISQAVVGGKWAYICPTCKTLLGPGVFIEPGVGKTLGITAQRPKR